LGKSAKIIEWRADNLRPFKPFWCGRRHGIPIAPDFSPLAICVLRLLILPPDPAMGRHAGSKW
jgi:hypothetical protein